MKMLFTLSILCYILYASAAMAQDSVRKGAIKIFTEPSAIDVKVKISELKYKQLKGGEELFIPDVPPGEYTVMLTYNTISNAFKLKETCYVPPSDTIAILADFFAMRTTSGTLNELRAIAAQERRLQQIEDSINAVKEAEALANSLWDTLSFEMEDDFDQEEIYFIVEDMPTFNGGEPALEFRKYIAMNLRYPEEAAVKKKSGRAIVQFNVNPDGRVRHVVIAVSTGDESLDAEAVRVVSSSPRWKPGHQRGKPVTVQFTFPINFVLGN